MRKIINFLVCEDWYGIVNFSVEFCCFNYGYVLQVGVVFSNGKVEDEIFVLKGYNWQEQFGGQFFEK